MEKTNQEIKEKVIFDFNNLWDETRFEIKLKFAEHNKKDFSDNYDELKLYWDNAKYLKNL